MKTTKMTCLGTFTKLSMAKKKAFMLNFRVSVTCERLTVTNNAFQQINLHDNGVKLLHLFSTFKMLRVTFFSENLEK